MPDNSTIPPSGKRLLSLDAYRGFVMLAMASGGLGLWKVAENFPDRRLWQFLGYQSSHVEWGGCAFWDLIQPSFMFMVGVSLPYSYAHRVSRGDSHGRTAAHALYRSVVLVALGVFLYSMGRNQTHFTFVNVLAQIGMGYFFLFLLVNRPNWFVWLAAIVILVGYWLAFAVHPLPPPDFDPTTVGVPRDFGGNYTGFFAHWNKNANFASDFDLLFLNLLPAERPFQFNGGGYQTLNFVPSLATMIFGLLTGRMLLAPGAAGAKGARLLLAGGAALAVGWALGEWVCPIVKRIWTPSWAVFSTGWTLWMLGGFYWVIDVWGWKRWAFPLFVVGANSIAMYLLAETLHRFIAGALQTHLNLPAQALFGHGLFEGTYGPILESVSVLCILWLVCWWLWRRRIFIKI